RDGLWTAGDFDPARGNPRSGAGRKDGAARVGKRRSGGVAKDSGIGAATQTPPRDGRSRTIPRRRNVFSGRGNPTLAGAAFRLALFEKIKPMRVVAHRQSESFLQKPVRNIRAVEHDVPQPLEGRDKLFEVRPRIAGFTHGFAVTP